MRCIADPLRILHVIMVKKLSPCEYLRLPLPLRFPMSEDPSVADPCSSPSSRQGANGNAERGGVTCACTVENAMSVLNDYESTSKYGKMWLSVVNFIDTMNAH